MTPAEIRALADAVGDPLQSFNALKTATALRAYAALLERDEAEDLDARRYRALVWADGEMVEGDRKKPASYWEYKPAGYDGMDCNRFYMGPDARSFEECADAARLALEALK